MPLRRWYVVRTHTRREVQVERVLAARGLETCLPQILSWKKDDKGQRRREPLFPGYLFARLQVPSDEWLAARSAPGVTYFLGRQGGALPAPVPDLMVQEIRQQCELRLRRGWSPDLKPGDRVTMASGPLAGIEAVFDGLLSPSGRSRVLVQILSRMVPVEVAIDLLRRAV